MLRARVIEATHKYLYKRLHNLATVFFMDAAVGGCPYKGSFEKYNKTRNININMNIIIYIIYTHVYVYIYIYTYIFLDDTIVAPRMPHLLSRNALRGVWGAGILSAAVLYFCMGRRSPC